MDAKTELLERLYWAVVDYLNYPPELDSHGKIEDELEDAMESARAELAACGVMVETIKRPRKGDIVRQIGGQQIMIVINPALRNANGFGIFRDATPCDSFVDS